MDVKLPDETFIGWFRTILEVIPIVLISMFGGLVNILNSKKTGFSFGLFFTGLITASFVGLIINSICEHMGVSGSGKFVAVSLGGYCSRDILDLLKSWFLEKAKKLADQDNRTK